MAAAQLDRDILNCIYFRTVNRVTVTPVILDLNIKYTPEGGVPQLAEYIHKNKNKMGYFYIYQLGVWPRLA